MNLTQDTKPDARAYQAQCREALEQFLMTLSSHPSGRGTRWVWIGLLETFLKRVPEEE